MLYQRDMAQGPEYAIRIAGQPGDLMNSRTHGSEDALGALACSDLRAGAQVLIGGLGMGFTLAASLAVLAEDATAVVAELVPGVVAWNQGVLGGCAGQPLKDARTDVRTDDVYDVMLASSEQYDAILLDVDNGPEGLTHNHNNRLYSHEGLQTAWSALDAGGLLAVWSVSPDREFVARMKSVGFSVVEQRVRAHAGKGSRHVIWLGRKTHGNS